MWAWVFQMAVTLPPRRWAASRIVSGSSPEDIMRAKAATTTPEWPHAFTRLQVPPEEFLATYPCNHIHGLLGNWVEEIVLIGKLMGVETKVYQ